MENLETYLYVFFAVVYIISRVLKARSKQNAAKRPIVKPQTQHQPQTVAAEPQAKKGFSFDDILKEFEKNLGGEEHHEEEVVPIKEIKYQEPVPIAEKVAEERPNRFQDYKDTKIGYKKSALKSGSLVFARNEKFKIEKDIASDYVKMLQDPDGFRNAFVLSEIINRKYY